VRIDSFVGGALEDLGSQAAAIEAQGFDAAWTGETTHDPFLACLQAINATSTIEVGTSIAIAFARTPMTLAHLAYDLQRYSGGRFVLGLGSQIKPHIEARFSMPWSQPAARMRELVLAIRAIWDTWQHGTPLDFRGEHYTHTLMTPFFSPEPLSTALPPIFVAAVGERMTEVAGEVADGLFVHAFTTADYLREVTVPALARGAERAERSLSDLQICGGGFVAVGEDGAGIDRAVQRVKEQIAFYASTPSYRGVLDLHGWGDLQPRLRAMSKQGQWVEMADLISDEVVAAFAVVGTPAEVGPALLTRYGQLVTRLTLPATVDWTGLLLP
jgi:probable F420-dependent oxidoreductase